MSNDQEFCYSSLQNYPQSEGSGKELRVSPILRTPKSNPSIKKQVSFQEKTKVIMVENWKDYNIDVSEESKCTCTLQ